MIIIVMGPAGAGKTTVGEALAASLGWRFVEADDLHPPENVAKMRVGVGLTHVDRMPWLSAVRQKIDEAERASESVVIACSALTNDYRAMLSADADDVRFVYLHATRSLLDDRLRSRTGHFAGPSLLASQLATLESPGPGTLTLDASATPTELVSAIRGKWHL
jgi:gluconokinase